MALTVYRQQSSNQGPGVADIQLQIVSHDDFDQPKGHQKCTPKKEDSTPTTQSEIESSVKFRDPGNAGVSSHPEPHDTNTNGLQTIATQSENVLETVNPNTTDDLDHPERNQRVTNEFTSIATQTEVLETVNPNTTDDLDHPERNQRVLETVNPNTTDDLDHPERNQRVTNEFTSIATQTEVLETVNPNTTGDLDHPERNQRVTNEFTSIATQTEVLETVNPNTTDDLDHPERNQRVTNEFTSIATQTEVLETVNPNTTGDLDHPERNQRVTNEFTSIATQTEVLETVNPNTTDDLDHPERNQRIDSRQQWSNEVEFLMSCIAMSVGLGNVWRFPYTAFNNGGGAFLIAYIVVLILVGIPIYYMELAIGQFISGGPVEVWHISPALRGLGYGQIFATTLVLTYYCPLMAITLFYLYNSFQSELPWSTCDPSWSNCVDSKKYENTTQIGNFSDLKSCSELYFYKTVLKEKESIEDGIGFPDCQLSLCLFFAWTTIFLVLVKEVNSSGKAAYFLAIFPYVVMIILLIRGVTLPGALEGIYFLFEPQWEELLNLKVWYSAVTQAFFSLGVCFGALSTYSSHNDFHHKVYREALIVTTLDTFTSLLAGCTTFSILGNLMKELGISDIKHVVQKDTGLVFVSYPDAIAKFNMVPQFFSVVFFLMLYTLGIGTAVALAAAVISVICDKFTKVEHGTASLVLCIVGFLVGLIYVTPGGQYMLTLVDFYGVNYTVFILGTIEITGIAWIYGTDNFCIDLEFMVNNKISRYWRLCWEVIIPIVMIITLIYSITIMQPETYHNKPFPTSSYEAGWIIFAFGVLQFPIWALIAIFKNKHQESVFQAIISAFQPSELWKPKDCKIAMRWRQKREQISVETCCEYFKRWFLGYTSYEIRGGSQALDSI